MASAGAWRDAYLDLHGASHMTLADTAPWEGRLEWRRSPSYGIALCGGTQQSYSRDTRHIRADPRGTRELLVPLAGGAVVDQGASSGELRPGLLGLCEIDRPVAFGHRTDFVSIALIVPGHELERRGPALVREPQVLNGAKGLGRVIRQMVITLQEEQEQLSDPTFDIACEQLLDLVCLAADGASDSAPREQRAAVAAQIRRYIRTHASEPSLNIVGIARALGWSTRYIQDVLKDENTTSRELVRQERLRLARIRLAGASWAGHTVAEIAYACGFGSHSSFSTAFRQEFGLTPRDARQGVTPSVAEHGAGTATGPSAVRADRPEPPDTAR